MRQHRHGCCIETQTNNSVSTAKNSTVCYWHAHTPMVLLKFNFFIIIIVINARVLRCLCASYAVYMYALSYDVRRYIIVHIVHARTKSFINSMHNKKFLFFTLTRALLLFSTFHLHHRPCRMSSSSPSPSPSSSLNIHMYIIFFQRSISRGYHFLWHSTWKC